MSLSDCERCWETPCSCGWDYIDWDNNRIKNYIILLNKILECKEKYPKATKDEIYKLLLDFGNSSGDVGYEEDCGDTRLGRLGRFEDT